MRFASYKNLGRLTIVMVMALIPGFAQQQINPHTQIKWPFCPTGATLYSIVAGTCVPPSGGTVQVEDTTTGVNQAIIDFNSTLPAAPFGAVNIKWQNDTATGRKSAYIPGSLPPELGNFIPVPVAPAEQVIIYASSCAQTNIGTHNSIPASHILGAGCTGSSGFSGMPFNDGGSFISSGSITWTGFPLPSYVSPSSVTAAYVVMISSLTGGPPSNLTNTVDCSDPSTGHGVNGFPSVLANYTTVTSIEPWSALPNFANASAFFCTYQMSRTTGGPDTIANIPLLAMVVDYVGTAPPTGTATLVANPLYFNPTTDTLALSPLSSITPTTVANLPIVGTTNWPLSFDQIQLVSNLANSTGVCTGGGSITAWCQWNGTAWNVFAGPGQLPLPGFLYSAAGTPLPACNVSSKGTRAEVSDATVPLYMTAYTGGGAITAEVLCSYNGSTYTWLTK